MTLTEGEGNLEDFPCDDTDSQCKTNENAVLEIAHVENVPEPEQTVKRLGTFQILMMNMGMLGLQLGWAFEYTFMTPSLTQLGVPPQFAGSAWMFSPALAFFAVPFIGAWSDTSQFKWGRRRPFLATFVFTSVVCMVIIPFASQIGKWIDPSNNYLQIIFLIIVYVGQDLSNKIVESLLRSLIPEVVPEEQIATSNAWMSALAGLGSAAGYFIGFSNLTLIPLYAIGIAAYVPATIMTLIAGKERRFIRPPDFVKVNPFVEMYRGLKTASFPLILLLLQQIVAQIGLWPIWTYLTDWEGVTVFNGSPNSQSSTHGLFEDGVRAGSLACGLMAVCNMLISFALIPLMKILNLKLIYIVCQLISSVALILLAWARNKYVVQGLVCFGGFSWAANGTIPYAIVYYLTTEETRGLVIGMLYITVTMAQLIVALTFGPFFSLFTPSLTPNLVAGGVFMIFGAIIMVFIPTSPSSPKEEEAEQISVEKGSLSYASEQGTINDGGYNHVGDDTENY